MWGATQTVHPPPYRSSCFNSRTPCGVRHLDQHNPLYGRYVSIHAPHVGCDMAAKRMIGDSTKFQFTHPVWGATKRSSWMFRNTVVSIHAPRVGRDDDAVVVFADLDVSIHAPRVGCDTKVTQSSRSSTSFNSRTPCGARHLVR